MSATPDSTFADSQQINADLRRQLAECRAERDAALAREAAMADVLRVINSVTGDLAPVFDAILEKAMSLCEAAHGYIWIYDGERVHLVAVRGEPRFVEWMHRLGSMHLGSRPLGRPSPLGRVVRGEPIAHVVDAREEEAYRSNPIFREQVDVGGLRAILDIGLRKGDALLGVIAVYRQEVRPFTDEQIALLQNFAAQAVIAMENARLITETREALEQQTATAEMLQVVNFSPGDLAPVFDAMLEKATRVCEAAFGALVLHEGDDRYRPVAMRGFPAARVDYWGNEPVHLGPGTPSYRLVCGDHFVHLLDAAEDEAYRSGNPYWRALVEDDGVRTWLAMPLRKDGALHGILYAFRQEVRPFSDKQIALLQNFAAQAVIAVENARLLRETREALEQQTATAEVLQVINSSPGDLAPVFEAMLARAHSLCGADNGGLLTYDGEGFWPVAFHGLSTQLTDVRLEGIDPNVAPSFGRIVQGERLDHIHDMVEFAAQLSDDAVRERVLALEADGIRTQLIVALRKDDLLLGAIIANRRVMQPFSEKEIALLENFAAQAVIAMENARLITETREALERQTATAEILRVISASPTDLQPTLDAIAASATILTGAVNGAVSRFDGSLIHAAAHYGWTEEELKAVRCDFPRPPGRETTTTRAILTREVVHIPDVVADPEYRAHGLLKTAMRTGLSVPILQDGNPVGAITVTRREVAPFSQAQIDLLKTFADQAVIAIENVRLFNETREALEQQTATAEVLQVINSSPGDLKPVFDAIIETAVRLCDAEMANLDTHDGERYRPVAAFAATEEGIAFLRGLEIVPGRGTTAGRALLERRAVHITDITADPEYALPEAVTIMNYRTTLAVPLLREGEPIGVIILARSRVAPFSQRQIALVENFAAQAVIAMENARLLTETREALEQQTATAEVLQVINSSPGDRTPVFEAILEKARVLCGAAHGNLSLYDGERFRVVAINTRSQELADRARQGFLPSDYPHLKALLDGARLAHVPDLAEIGNPFGARTGLFVPLRKDNALLGMIAAIRLEIRPFSDKEIALLQNFAAQAVVAMENARLLGELRQRTEEVAELNRGLEARVAEQVEELGRVGRLKRFLAPQLAELIVSQGDEKILESHRREIVVVFCDLRGYTAVTETAEPEEVLRFPARIPRRVGAAGQPVRGDARPVLRRRDHGVLQ